MSTFANIVNQALPDVEVQVNATGAATAHALETARGRMDFFMSSPTVHAMMMQGTAMYAKITDAKELRSEEHTSELQSLMRISYAVFCLKKKKQNNNNTRTN